MTTEPKQFCRHSGEQSAPTDRGTLTETVECGEELCEHGACPSCDGDCKDCHIPDCNECGEKLNDMPSMGGFCEPCQSAKECQCGNVKFHGDKYCSRCTASEAGDRAREYAKDERGW